MSALLGSEFRAIVPVCMCLSALHLGANHMSVRCLGVPTFDSQVCGVWVQAAAGTHARHNFWRSPDEGGRGE